MSIFYNSPSVLNLDPSIPSVIAVSMKANETINFCFDESLKSLFLKYYYQKRNSQSEQLKNRKTATEFEPTITKSTNKDSNGSNLWLISNGWMLVYELIVHELILFWGPLGGQNIIWVYRLYIIWVYTQVFYRLEWTKGGTTWKIILAFSNTKMLQTVRVEKVDKKNGVICLVSMFPSWFMVLKLSKKVCLF